MRRISDARGIPKMESQTNSENIDYETNYYVDRDWFVIDHGDEILRGRYVDASQFVWEINGKEVDAKEWVALYKKWASDFEIDRCFAIGFICEHEYKVGNLRGAAAGWRIGAELGNPRALYELGIYLRDGELGAKDPEGAFRLFQQGADKGHAHCIRELASCYANGIGVVRDEKKAVETLNRAADLGDILAIFGQATTIFFENDSDPRWIPLAKRVVEIGLKKNLNTLKYYVADFDETTSQEKREAYSLRRCAYMLGVGYINGVGAEHNEAEAFKYFQIAAECGDPEGVHEAGLCVLKGEGRPADEEEARQYFLRAARLGYPPSMLVYAQLAWHKATSVFERVEAVRWLRLAARLGDEDTKCYALEYLSELQALFERNGLDISAIQGEPQGWGENDSAEPANNAPQGLKGDSSADNSLKSDVKASIDDFLLALFGLNAAAFFIHRALVPDSLPRTFGWCGIVTFICVLAYVGWLLEKLNKRSPNPEDKIRPVNITEIEPALRQFADAGNMDAAAIVNMLDEIRNKTPNQE